jgi:hypothetical protein
MLIQENSQLRLMEEELIVELRQKYLLIIDSLRSDEEATKEYYTKQETKLVQEKN